MKAKTQIEAEDKEKNMDALVRNLAQIMLKENQAYVGKDIAEAAIEEIKKEGEEQDEKQTKTTRRKKQTTK